MIYLFSVFCFLILFAYLTTKNTTWGIYLISALLPTYLIRFDVFGIPMTLLEGMILILFVIWLASLKLRRSGLIKIHQQTKLTFNPIIWFKHLTSNLQNHASRLQPPTSNLIPQPFRLPIILLLIASTISVFVAPNMIAALGIWKAYFIEAVMFLIVFVYTVKTTEQMQKVIRCLGLTVLAIGIFAVYQKLTGALIPNPFWANELTRRVTTFFGYPNANALFVVPIFFLTLGNLLSKLNFSSIQHPASKNKYRLLIILDFVIMASAIITSIFARSNGAIIALIIGIISICLIYTKTRLACLIAILAVMIFATFSPTVQNNISINLLSINQLKLPINPTDWQIRTQQWRETMNMLKDRPLLGAGLSGYQTDVAPYHVNKHIEIFMYPHNFFLNFWTETGLLGLIAIIWLLLIFFKQVYLNIKNFKLIRNSKLEIRNSLILTIITTSSMIALLVQGLVDVPYFKNDLSILFWIIIGIVIVLHNQKIELKENN